MTTDQHRLAASLVTLAAAAIMAMADGLASGLTLLAGCGLALVLIWFAEELADFVGNVGWRRIHRPSPPGLVRLAGWALLVLFVAGAVAAFLR